MKLRTLIELNEASKAKLQEIFDVYKEDSNGDDIVLHNIIKTRFGPGARIRNSNKDIEAMWDLYKEYTKK